MLGVQRANGTTSPLDDSPRRRPSIDPSVVRRLNRSRSSGGGAHSHRWRRAVPGSKRCFSRIAKASQGR